MWPYVGHWETVVPKKNGASHCGEIKSYHKKIVSGVYRICMRVGTSGRVF